MTQEALKLALDALEQTLQTLDDENAKPGGAIADTIWHSEHETLFDYLGSEITAIKEALAEHAMQEVQRLGQEIEQEPVAWFHPHKGFYWAKPTSISAPTIADVEPLPLYTTPPQRTWVGLTNKERAECWETIPELAMKKVEAKLKEKNT
jgi:hypothetical protein